MMLKSSLAQTESESARMDTEKANIDEKMSILEKSIMNLHTKTKDIRDDIINHASEQKTTEKSSAFSLTTKRIQSAPPTVKPVPSPIRDGPDNKVESSWATKAWW